MSDLPPEDAAKLSGFLPRDYPPLSPTVAVSVGAQGLLLREDGGLSCVQHGGWNAPAACAWRRASPLGGGPVSVVEGSVSSPSITPGRAWSGDTCCISDGASWCSHIRFRRNRMRGSYRLAVAYDEAHLGAIRTVRAVHSLDLSVGNAGGERETAAGLNALRGVVLGPAQRFPWPRSNVPCWLDFGR